MAVFKSNLFDLKSTPEVVSAFLAEPKNLFSILPQDRVENWNHSESECSFKIKGLAHISLKLDHASSNQVTYTSNAEKPFSFSLNINLEEMENSTKLHADFDADVNAFMGTMLSGPLTNFLNYLGAELKKKYS